MSNNSTLQSEVELMNVTPAFVYGMPNGFCSACESDFSHD